MVKIFQVDSGSTLNTNLIAYYPLSDVTEFFEGNGSYDLTNNNSVSFNSGKVGNAADGGATNTNKSLSSSNALTINGGNCSISIWVNITTQISAGTYTFFDQNNNSTNTGYTIRYEYNAGTRRLAWVRQRLGTADDAVYETVTLTTGTWYHFVLTYNSTNVEGWRDNVSKGTVASSGNGASAGTTGIRMLASAGAANFTSGLVDECGVWSKKLSNAEISDLYNSGNGQTMVSGTTKNILIFSSIIQSNSGTGVVLTNLGGVVITNSSIRSNSGYGVSIDSNCLLTRIVSNHFESNTNGSINDSGIRTLDANNIKI